MDRTFLTRKDWVVHRPRIDRLLATGLEYPLTLIVAGPSYGKTTAVMDFCRRTRRKLFWLHLLPIDNDADCFWNRCCDALQLELPRLSKDLSQSGFPDTLAGFHAFLKTLTKELYADTEVLVVFDNAENVTNPRVRRFIESLIRVELENMCIFFICNTRPSFDGLAGGRCFYIGAGELQFTEDEIGQLFERYGIALGQAERDGLLGETGGWPLALHLAASHPQRPVRCSDGGTSHMQAVFELFEQDYFMGYTAAAQSMLAKLSFFEAITPGLVQAIAPDDARRVIRELGHNIFISYDHHRGLFYLQKMYRDFLKQKRALLGEDEICLMQSRAGDWFRKTGKYQEALECYWQISDYERYVSAVLEVPRRRISNRMTNLVLDRLNRMPEAFVRAHPVVDLIRGFLYMYDLRVVKSKEVFLSLAGRLEGREKGEGERLLLGEVYTALADISFMRNDLEGMEFVSKAASLLPEGTRTHSPEVLIAGNNEVFFLSDSESGRLEFMKRYLFEFLEPAKRLYNDSGKGFTFLFAAEAAYCAECFEDVMEYSTKAFHVAAAACQTDIAANVFLSK